MGFNQTRDLKLYEYTKEKTEKSWVSGELKIWIVMKKAEKRSGLAELNIWIFMNILRKKQKNHGFRANKRFVIVCI